MSVLMKNDRKSLGNLTHVYVRYILFITEPKRIAATHFDAFN